MKIKNPALAVGIALPLVFIAAISIVVFTPSLSIKPVYNFIYTTDDSPYGQGYQNTYTINDGHIAVTPVPVEKGQTPKADMPQLYLYDVQSDTAHQISFDQAAALDVDPGPSSPDGYTVQYESSNDGIFQLFGSDDSSQGYFISKGNGRKKLNGLAGNGYYQQDFNLIGWVQ
jgi:hypothetical protein